MQTRLANERVRGGRAAGCPSGLPPAAASSRLEPSGSNLKSDHPVGFAAVIACKCRCRTCRKCGPRMGWRVRQKMLTKAHGFRVPAMLTLTVDRKRFIGGPEEAHRVITEGSYIARLMRLLGVVTWFWVLEFQTKSGRGWPHWHLLIDLADVGGRLDLARAWRLWRDKWHLGGLDLSAPRGFHDPSHAVFYVTKYLTKMPSAFPPWVLDRSERAIRFVGGCKALGAITGDGGREFEGEIDPQLKLFRSPRTPLLIRMARCEMAATIFGVHGDSLTGQGGWRWMGQIDCTPDDLLELSEQGLVSVRMAAVDFGERELLVLTEASIGGVVSALHRLPDELQDRDVGYADYWRKMIVDRETAIRQHHENFWN